MSYSDEQLMAYVDGQCNADECTAIEAAAAADPHLAARLDRQRAQRRALVASLSNAFDPMLSEPVPPRLLDTLQRPHTDNVVPLKPRTAAALAPQATQTDNASSRGNAQGSKTWIAMAASLVVGVLLGMYALQPTQQSTPQSSRPDLSWLGLDQNSLVTQGALSTALNEQLASKQTADAPVRMAISFRDQAGHYCRSFVVTDQQLAGLACRVNSQWQVRVLSATDSTAASSDSLRQAGSSLPSTVLNVIDTQIKGDALDAVAEQQAQQAGWQ